MVPGGLRVQGGVTALTVWQSLAHEWNAWCKKAYSLWENRELMGWILVVLLVTTCWGEIMGSAREVTSWQCPGQGPSVNAQHFEVSCPPGCTTCPAFEPVFRTSVSTSTPSDRRQQSYVSAILRFAHIECNGGGSGPGASQRGASKMRGQTKLSSRPLDAQRSLLDPFNGLLGYIKTLDQCRNKVQGQLQKASCRAKQHPSQGVKGGNSTFRACKAAPSASKTQQLPGTGAAVARAHQRPDGDSFSTAAHSSTVCLHQGLGSQQEAPTADMAAPAAAQRDRCKDAGGQQQRHAQATLRPAPSSTEEQQQPRKRPRLSGQPVHQVQQQQQQLEQKQQQQQQPGMQAPAWQPPQQQSPASNLPLLPLQQQQQAASAAGPPPQQQQQQPSQPELHARYLQEVLRPHLTAWLQQQSSEVCAVSLALGWS